jgi:hypothetical protein
MWSGVGRGCVEKSRKLAAAYRALPKRLGCHYLDAGILMDRNEQKGFYASEEDSLASGRLLLQTNESLLR